MSQALSAAIAIVDGTGTQGFAPPPPSMSASKSNPTGMHQMKHSHTTTRTNLARETGSTKHQPAPLRSEAVNATPKNSSKVASSATSIPATYTWGKSDSRCAAAEETVWTDGSDHGGGDSDEATGTSAFSQPPDEYSVHGSARVRTMRARTQEPAAYPTSEDAAMCRSKGEPAVPLTATFTGAGTRTTHGATNYLSWLFEDEYLELINR